MLKEALELLVGEIKTNKGLVIGRGHNLSTPDKKIDIILSDQSRTGHLWCFGTTRVGKTKLMENMIEQDIRNGNSVIIIDPKGDYTLFSKIIQTALEENRQDDLIFITPIFPECSSIIDPLAHYYMPEELVGHIVSGVEIGKEKFFYNVAYEISLIIVQALLMLSKVEGVKPTFNLNDVKNRISREELEKLKSEIDSIDTDEARQLSNDMTKILSSPADYYSKVSSSLRVALMELSSGNIGRIIGKADENRLIKRLENNKRVITVVHVGSLITRKAAFTLGKVIISMIQSFVGRVFASGKKVQPPLSIYIDEAQNVLYYGIDDLFAKAGGAAVWLSGFSQSVNQIYAAIGEDYGNAILDNTNTKIFMKVPDSVTAEYVASHFGEHKVLSPILNLSGGMTAREVEEDILRESEILNLRERVFYAMTYSGNYKGRTLDVSKLYIEVVFPEIKMEA